MEKTLLNLMAFLLLPGIGTASNNQQFEEILKLKLSAETDEGKNYEILQVISEVEELKNKYLQSLGTSKPYGDLLATADRFLKYCTDIINEEQIDNSNELSNPQKIKILWELGFIPNFLIKEKGFTQTNAEKLVAKLFDISARQVKTNLNSRTHEDFAKKIIDEIKNQPSKN